jgi:DNA-directed RNA polymerase-3 subunit RPC5
LDLPAEVDDPSIPHDSDNPGPSSLFIPRSPSPALPDLRSKPFPPDAAEAAAYDSDDEDEVLAVLPVYISTQLSNQLHIYQYPLHTQSRPLQAPLYALDRAKNITVRVKEQVDRIEVEVPVDRGEDVWRTDEATQMGFVPAEDDPEQVVGGVGYDGSAAQAKKKKKREAWGENMRLSSQVMPRHTPYFAGVVVEGMSTCRKADGKSKADM